MGELDRAGVVRLEVRARVGPEVRQLADGEVDLDGAGARVVVLDVRDEVVRQLAPVDEAEERDLGMGVGDDDRRVDLLAALEDDAARRAVGEDPRDRRVGPDGSAVLRPTASRWLRLTAPIPPSAKPQLPMGAGPDVSDRVVEHDVRGAGLVGSGPRPDDPVDRQADLDRSDSNQSSRRSAADIVMSRVRSATPRPPRPRSFHAKRSWSRRSGRTGEPSFGGVIQSRCRTTWARRSFHSTNSS